MPPRDRLHRMIWTAGRTIRAVWNQYHRVRIGAVLLLVCLGAIPWVRSQPIGHRLGPGLAIAGGFMLVVALIGGDLSTIAGQWRTEHLETLAALEDEATNSDRSPETVAARLPDRYAHVATLRASSWESGGKSIAWACPPGFVGWVGLGWLILTLPVPQLPDYGPIMAIVAGLLLFVGILGGHELLHGGVARWQGAAISFGLWPLGAYCEYTETLLSRRAIITITAAPLLVLSGLAVGFMAFGWGPLYLLGVVILVYHTPMAGGDVVQIGGFLFHSPDTYFYPLADGDGIWVFKPMDQDHQTVLARLDAALARLSAPLTLP